MKSLAAIGFCLLPLAAALAYNNKYEPGDTWSLEECMPAPETGDAFIQGEPKREYNDEDPIWFYLESPIGEDATEAVPLGFSGLYKSGWGWSHAEDTESGLSGHIGGYPLIYKIGRQDNTIATHPGEENDLVVAWESPVTGNVAVECVYTRQDSNGDGQMVSLYRGKHQLAEELAGDASQDLIIEKERVAVKKGERIYLRINKRDSINNDSGLVRFKVTLL